MKSNSILEEYLLHQEEFKFKLPDEVERGDLCAYAKHFATWAKKTYQSAAKQPTIISINQDMLLLLKQYFEWREAVPKAHRDHINGRSHICIFHIFERTYYQLKVLELSLSRPMLFLPPQPAPQVTKIYKFEVPIGEAEQDENDLMEEFVQE